MNFLKKLGVSVWNAVRPIAVKPHTWVVILTAAAGYAGKQLAPDTYNAVADVIVNIIGGF